MIIETNKFGMENKVNESILNSADELVYDMHKEYRKYCKLLELAKKDRIETIKKLVRYPYINKKLLINAQKWLSMKVVGIDKRKKYEEKESFESLQNTLINELFGRPIEITEISFLGYDECACMIDFKVSDYDTCFQLTIPDTSKLSESEEKWNYMYGGKLALHYYEDNSSLDYIHMSYKEEDIKKALNDFLICGTTKVKIMEL